jgi:branched-chain amino acid transport system substrate-binding protein
MNRLAKLTIAILATMGVASAQAQQKTPGVSDSEIKIGQFVPLSGPLSFFSSWAKTQDAYFQMLNEKGGVNGRKIILISRDDQGLPPKTVEQVRRLVEQDEVLAIFSGVGTAQNFAVRAYLNQRKVPQLFVASGAPQWATESAKFPWSIAFSPNAHIEGSIFGRNIRKQNANARIAVLYENNDFGRDLLTGLKRGLGPEADKMIVASATYEPTDATVDSQVITLRESKADTLVIFAIPKSAAQAIRKAYDIGWQPQRYVASISANAINILGPDAAKMGEGLITGSPYKSVTDDRWKGDADFEEWSAVMKKYYPDGDARDPLNAQAYVVAQALAQVLKQAGSDLTRENVMKQALNLRDLRLPLMAPGVVVNTGPNDYSPIEQMQMMQFNGKIWAVAGDLISGE